MNPNAPTIAFYISGHGFGHATRTIEVARWLPADFRVLFRTPAPRWLFEQNCDRPFEYEQIRLDVGVVQQDSLTQDIVATLAACQKIMENREALLDNERKFIEQERVDLLFADIPPPAFDLAEQCAIPSIGMTNFSWDWIYKSFAETQPGYMEVIEEMRRSFDKCDLLLRLPFHGDLSAFPNMEDIPLVVRQPELSREQVYERLKLDSDKPLVLLSFGGFNLDRIPWDRIAKLTEYEFVSPFAKSQAENIHLLKPGMVPHVDIVAATDVVIAKAGYGLCAEIVRTGTPTLYADRVDFAEYHMLVEGMKKHARALHIPRTELLEGDLRPWIERAMRLPPSKEPISCNGAEVAAQKIMERLN